MGVAGVGVGAVLRALPALRCGCGGPGRGVGARAGTTPPASGVPGAAVGAAARLAGAAVSAPCAPGAPSGGGAAVLAAWEAGAVFSAITGPRIYGSVSVGATQGCSAGGPTGTAASARVSPAHPEETGERDRDQWWWRSSRWEEPSESDITVILVGMRGGRRALPTTSWCICVVQWAVLCSASQGGGGGGGAAVVLAPCGRGPVAIHQHWGERWVSHAAHTSRHNSQSGARLRALGPRGSSGVAEGSRTRWTP